MLVGPTIALWLTRLVLLGLQTAYASPYGKEKDKPATGSAAINKPAAVSAASEQCPPQLVQMWVLRASAVSVLISLSWFLDETSRNWATGACQEQLALSIELVQQLTQSMTGAIR